MLPNDRALQETLARLGHEAFRPGQRAALESLLQDGRLLLVAPTGGGKSLVYQLPALLLPGTTVVISPLVALMHDQVQALEARGIAATYFAATVEPRILRQRLARLAAGDFRIVYAAPERVRGGAFTEIVTKIPVPLLAVDEAHCISEWGHDFRPDYLALGDFVAALAQARVLACTATATPVVRDEIVARLGLPADTRQIVLGFARSNLHLEAREIFEVRERHGAVDGILARALGSGDPQGTAIVYAPTRATAEREAERLGHAGRRAAAYHAGLEPSTRERVQEAFAEGRLPVVVATNAFGMGIDRADVRAVVHLAPPGSIEAYYQEVGRAGRDGAPAYGLLLSSAQDVALRRRLLEAPIDGRAPSPAVVEHKWGLFLELMRWAEGGSCRHDAILRYFGADEVSEQGCGRCDVCTQLAAGAADVDEAEATLLVRKALSAAARIHGRFGLQAAVALLAGAADPRLRRSQLDATPTFGALGERDPRWILRLLRRCVTAGWIEFSGDERPVALLSAEGREVMRGVRPARLLLPPDLAAPAAATTPARPRAAATPPPPEDQDLFEALRHLRVSLAREDGIPPYVVASDRTLREVAAHRPRSRTELLLVHGIGPAKAARWGSRVLELVARFAPA